MKIGEMIYKLTRINNVGYDEYDSKVVRAKNPGEARDIANEVPGDEGRLWDDPNEVSCEIVDPEGESVEIMGSFNAG